MGNTISSLDVMEISNSNEKIDLHNALTTMNINGFLPNDLYETMINTIEKGLGD